MTDRSANFGFLLDGHDPVFHQLALSGERALHFDPNTTLLKVRQLAEAFARHAAAACGVLPSPQLGFLDILRALESRRIVEDEATKRAHVLGRLSILVEELPAETGVAALEREVTRLQKKRDRLASEVSDEDVASRMQAILFEISTDMTTWARALGGTHSHHLHLDAQKLLVVDSTPTGKPVPMNKMGGADNWLACHLVATLAVQKWNANHNGPVPRVLFFDQPSQVYFPSDKDTRDGAVDTIVDEDRERVLKIFKLLHSVVEELGGRLQVVVTDHADLKEAFFQESVVEKWRGELKLVPDKWGDAP